MNLFRRYNFYLFFVFAISPISIIAQQVPFNPVSYRVFNPFILNPAIAGSKDFFSIDMVASAQKDFNAQIISGNTRITRKTPGYFSSPAGYKFTRIGIGGYFFNDFSSPSRNLGAGLGASYHLPLNKKNLSFLSIGASVKGVSFTRESVPASDPEPAIPAKNILYPNVDVGIYFYGPNLFAGVSATNLLGNPENSDTLGKFDVPVSRQYFFQAGYKILLSRSYNIVLEPSLIINSDGSSSQKTEDMLQPMMKLYMENFCVGTYFNDFRHYSVFFQYKYPRFYIGAFFQVPKNNPYFKKDLISEFTLGINLSGSRVRNHW
jgi:type IX secretion system PorP/SprF family membrane protein